MDNALHEPQTIVLLGGTSDIGLAIVRELLSPATRAVVLACRDTGKGEQAAAGLRRDGLTVDVVILAYALLGSGQATSRDGDEAIQVASVNFTGSVASLVAAGNVLRAQGHGSIVVLSSVAGERVRKANAVYGATKAGLDGFAQGLGDELAEDGVHVLVVRPGFVRSAMTEGLQAAPFATTPEAVAAATAKGLRSRRRIVWVPGLLRFVFMALRHTPGPIWRRLPLG